MTDYVYVARDMIIKILSNLEYPTEENLRDLVYIQVGDKERLLNHLKPIYNIFGQAIDELEGGENAK